GLALSMLEAESAEELSAHGAFMAALEAKGRLDRSLEGLPDAPAIADRAKTAPDDPYFLSTLKAYFPAPLARFEDEMRRHRLRREIIATVIGNEMINLTGFTFAARLMAAAGCDAGGLMVSFEAARQVLRFSEAWSRVTALDGQAAAAGQTALFRELGYVLRGQTYWLARRVAREGGDVAALIEAYQSAADELKTLFPAVLSPFEQKAAVRRAAG